MNVTDSLRLLTIVVLLTSAALLLSGCGGKGGRTFLNVRPGGIVDAYVVDLDPATSTLQDVETQNNLSTAADTDGDWLKDDVELALGTDPNDRDTDGDGLADSYELFNDAEGPFPMESRVDPNADGQMAVLITGDWRSDDDGDGIPNKLEYDGFYFSHDVPPDLFDKYPDYPFADEGIFPWDGDITKLYYKTDPTQKTSDGDPYDDKFEARGVNYPSVVQWPGKDPCVAAEPDIQVKVTSYTITRVAEITNEYNKEVMSSWTNAVETLDKTDTKHHYEAEANGEYGSKGWKVSGHVGTTMDTDHITSTKTTDTHSGYTKEDWKTVTTAKTDEAANIAFNYRVENCGTAPLSDVALLFSIKLGNKTIVSVDPGVTIDYLGVGPEEVWPLSGTWCVDKDQLGKKIRLSLDQLKSIDIGVPVQVVVSSVTAHYVAYDSAGNPLADNISWNYWRDNIRKVTCDVYVDLGDGNMRYSKVYIGMKGKDCSAPDTTIGEAILRSIRSGEQAQVTNNGIMYSKNGESVKPLSFDDWRFTFDQQTYDDYRDYLKRCGESQELPNFLNSIIKPRDPNNRAVIIAKAPPKEILKTPQIEWAYISLEPTQWIVKAYVTDYFALKDRPGGKGKEVKFHCTSGDYAMDAGDDGENADIYTSNLPYNFKLTGNEYIQATNDRGRTSRLGGPGEPGEGIPIVSDNWSMFGGDPARTNLSPNVGPKPNRHSYYNIAWKFKTDGKIQASPVVGPDGTVYVGSLDCNFYAVNPDGTEKWRYPLGEQIHSSAAVAIDGTIYIGGDDCTLHALHPDGTKKWDYPTGSYVNTHPNIGADGTIYFGSGGYLYAVTPEGDEKWKFNKGTATDLKVYSPAIGPDGTIYMGSDDKNFYAINPTDGSLKWEVPFSTSGPIQCTPAVRTVYSADGELITSIFFGSGDKKLYALRDNGATWSEKWNYALRGQQLAGLLLGVDAGPRICVGTVNNRCIYGLRECTGGYQTLWLTGYSKYGVYASPVQDAEHVIYYIDTERKNNHPACYLHGLVGATSPGGTCTKKGDYTFPKSNTWYAKSSPALAGGRLYVGFDDGYLYAFGP